MVYIGQPKLLENVMHDVPCIENFQIIAISFNSNIVCKIFSVTRVFKNPFYNQFILFLWFLSGRIILFRQIFFLFSIKKKEKAYRIQ